MSKGKLAVLEGLDGSGKSTQTPLVLGLLKKDGLDVRQLSYPDYDNPSSTLVKMYLGGELGSADDVNPYAASSFYAVDRYASYVTAWRDDFLNGKYFLATRYSTSNIIYQMSKLPKSEWDAYIDWVCDYEYNKLGLPKPDAVVLLKISPEMSAKQVLSRYDGDESKKDVHESNVAFMRRCFECASYAAQKLGWTIIECCDGDNMRSVPEITEDIYSALVTMFKNGDEL